MSVPVELTSLYDRIAEYGEVAYLVSVGESGLPHLVSVRVSARGDGLVTGAGRRTLANVVERPAVSMLWAAPPDLGYALIVDGEARPGGEDEGREATLLVRPVSAVLHRTPAGDPASPSCLKVLDPAPGGGSAPG